MALNFGAKPHVVFRNERPRGLQNRSEIVYTAVMGLDIDRREGGSNLGNSAATRKHTRIGCDLAVRFEGDMGTSHAATTVNISQSGLFVKAPALPAQNMLMLEVSISQAKTVFLWSEVRHRNADSQGSQVGFGVSVPAPPTVWREFCDKLARN